MAVSYINKSQLASNQELPCSSCSRNSCTASNAKIKLAESVPYKKIGGILIVADYPSSSKKDTWFKHSKFFQFLPDTFNEAGRDDLIDTVTYTAITRCGNSPLPTVEEASICFKYLKEEILRIKPKVIIAAGEIAASILCPAARLEPLYISYYRNTTYPINIEGHTCYLINSLPFFNLDKPPEINKFGKEVKDHETPLLLKNVLTYAIEYMNSPFVETANPTNILFPFIGGDFKEVQEGVFKKDGELYLFKNLLIEDNVKLLNSLLDKIASSKIVGFDYETNGLKPYNSGAKILSYSLSDGITTVSVLVNHLTLPLAKKGILHNSEVSLQVLKEFLSKDGYKILAHNLMFEMEWSLFFLGKGFLKKVKNDLFFNHFVDTMVFKFFLPCSTISRDSRMLALDDICIQKLGIPLKSIYSVDRINMASYPINTLLEYNAADAIVLPYIYNFYLDEAIKYDIMQTIYSFSEVIIATALIQYHGMPVNKDALLKIRLPLEEKLKELEESILSSTFGVAFREQFSRNINVISNQDIIWVLYTFYGLPRQYNAKTGQLSADKNILSKFISQIPDLQLILDYKGCSSFISKTLATLTTGITNQGVKVFEPLSGKIHFSLNPLGTETGRSSGGGGFNPQNIPKRGALALARDIFGVKGEGIRIVRIDSAQVDARNAAAASADANFIRRINENIDIHKHMAIKVAIISPSRFKLTGEKLSDKDLLGIVVNHLKRDGRDFTDKELIKNTTSLLRAEFSALELYEENSPHAEISEYMGLIVKKIRDSVKAGLVFARIYRASANTISRNMQVSPEEAAALIEALEQELPQLPVWHRDLAKFYDKYNAIRGFTGAIFFGPLDYGNIFNYTIQHATRLLMCNALGKLVKENIYNNFGGILCNEVHDEGTFIFSEKDFLANEKDIIYTLGKAFCIHEQDFFNIVKYGAEINVSKLNEFGHHGWKTSSDLAVVTSEDYGWKPHLSESEIQNIYERQFLPIRYTAPKIFL